MKLDETHDPRRKSWVKSANADGCAFPIQNLPFGVFRRKGSKEAPRGGVAIGNQVLDLTAAARALGLAGKALEAARAAGGTSLNPLAALGRPHWKALRLALSGALSADAPAKRQAAIARHLVPLARAELCIPVTIGDYTDFYTSSYHATNIGRMFRPDNPLMPNFKWIPIGYHGRSSSIVVSGTRVVRPNGQTKAADAEAPAFGPSKRLDYEVELGLVIGPGNALGKPVPLSRALDHVFGVVLLNDWSARDIQAWEYQPLGPFLAKNFASTVSPWIVTLEALTPFRAPALQRPAGDPQPLPYLTDAHDAATGHLDIEVEMWLRSAKMRAMKREPHRLSHTSYKSSYWTPAQLVAHHTGNGCNLRPGDLLGTGTISGPARGEEGALIEITQGGKFPVELPGGEMRAFIADGDELIQRARCARAGCVSIGFGEAAGRVVPAPAL
ncbi:MAG: fumarylacetoacetase [Betaproteobacteria bacterium]|nr:fumarylacetoacetase [Betaproteobacteria bacterium]